MGDPMGRDQSSAIAEAEERNGIQWRNVGPILAVFVASVVLTYVAGPGEGWMRAKTALATASVLLLVTMTIAGYLARFVGSGPFASIKVFAGVWIAVVLGWAFFFAR